MSPACARSANGAERLERAIVIEWRVGGGGNAPSWVMRWTLERAGTGGIELRADYVGGPASGATAVVRDVAWVIDPEDGRAHVDAGEHLRATLARSSDREWRVVYAHTCALTAHGVGGGQTDAPTARTVSAAASARSLAG